MEENEVCVLKQFRRECYFYERKEKKREAHVSPVHLQNFVEHRKGSNAIGERPNECKEDGGTNQPQHDCVVTGWDVDRFLFLGKLDRESAWRRSKEDVRYI